MTVSVTSVNDAPVGKANGTVTTVEDFSYTFSTTDFASATGSVFDPKDNPANALAGVRITTLPNNGQLLLNNVAVGQGDFVTATQIAAGQLRFAPAANANGQTYASFTFQVKDNGRTANGGADTDPSPKSLTIQVLSVNDAPQGTDRTINVIQSSVAQSFPRTFTASDFGFLDAPPNGSDSPPNGFLSVNIDALPTNGGTLKVNGVAQTAPFSILISDIDQLTYTSGVGQTANDTIKFRVQDDGGTDVVTDGVHTATGVDTDPVMRSLTMHPTAPAAGSARLLEHVGHGHGRCDLQLQRLRLPVHR